MVATRNVYPAKVLDLYSNEISFIIPCAGLSTRLRMKTSKCIAEVRENITVLDRNIQNIRSAYKNSDIIVVAGYEIERYRKTLKDKRVRVVYNENYNNTNVAYSVALGLDASISNQCVIIMGDLYYNVESIENIDINNNSKLLLSNGTIDEYEVGMIIDENNRITSMNYSSENKWGQIAYLSKRELDIIKNMCYNEQFSKSFFYELINESIKAGARYELFKVKNSFTYDIDTLEKLYKVIDYDNKFK